MKNIKWVVFIALIFFAAAIIFFYNVANAQSGSARIVYVKGGPKIMKTWTNKWKACEPGMNVDNGDRIKTIEEEAVEISFLKKNSNIIRIEPDSDVFIRKCEAPYSIELLSGTAMALIKDLPKGSTFEIRTPLGLSGARATGWTATTNGASALFSAFEESIYTVALDADGNVKGDMVTVMEGWRAILEQDKAIILERLAGGDIDRWNEWRRGVLDRLGISSMVNLDRSDATGRDIDKLESRKDSVNEARDETRIENRESSSSGIRVGDDTPN